MEAGNHALPARAADLRRKLTSQVEPLEESVTRVKHSEREMRRHLRLEKADVLRFQKRIVEQLSQTRNEISRTKRRLEE